MLNPRQITEVKNDIHRIEDQLHLPDFSNSDNMSDRLRIMLPFLRDLLSKAESCGHRIDFTDDIIIDDIVYDATSLIAHFKNCLSSHPNSEGHYLDGYDNARVTENILYGCSGPILKITGEESGYVRNLAVGSGGYHDDVTITVGEQNLLFKRHFIRAYREAVYVFSDLGIIMRPDVPRD